MPITVCHIFLSTPRYLSSIDIFTYNYENYSYCLKSYKKPIDKVESTAEREQVMPKGIRGTVAMRSDFRKKSTTKDDHDDEDDWGSTPAPSGTGARRGFLDQFRTRANARIKHKLFDRLEHSYSSSGDGFLS
jgi:hypothetical protein